MQSQWFDIVHISKEGEDMMIYKELYTLNLNQFTKLSILLIHVTTRSNITVHAQHPTQNHSPKIIINTELQ